MSQHNTVLHNRKDVMSHLILRNVDIETVTNIKLSSTAITQHFAIQLA